MHWKYLLSLLLLSTIACIFYIVFKRSAHINKSTKIRQHVPDFMLQLYHQNLDGRFSNGNEIVRSVIPNHASPVNISNNNPLEQKHQLVFDIPKLDRDEELIDAELRILLLMDEESKIEKLTGNRIVKLAIIDDISAKEVECGEINSNSSNNNWLTFNLSKIIHNNHNQVKLVITQRETNLSISPNNKDDFLHDYPVLLLFYKNVNTHTYDGLEVKEGTRNRQKLPAIDTRQEIHTKLLADFKRSTRRMRRFISYFSNNENERWENDWSYNKRIICRKKPLYVDFAEINYDTWIIQPRGYDAFQCQGKCSHPVAAHLSPTKHAIIQDLLHSVSPAKATKTCCVPTKLEAISILYIDDKGVLTYRYAYKDMVVSECGCR